MSLEIRSIDGAELTEEGVVDAAHALGIIDSTDRESIRSIMQQHVGTMSSRIADLRRQISVVTENCTHLVSLLDSGAINAEESARIRALSPEKQTIEIVRLHALPRRSSAA